MVTKNPRVVMVAPHKKYNVTEAKVFGELTYLLPERRVSVFQPEELIETLLKRLEEIEFDPTNDYIILTGGQYLVIALCSIAAHNFKRYQALMFDAGNSRYVSRTFNFEHATKAAGARTTRASE
jgi:hypothetical protein